MWLHGTLYCKRSVCSQCQYLFCANVTSYKACKISNKCAAKKRRANESEQECQLCRDSDRKCKPMKRAIETESETVAHRASNRLCTANKILLEIESETIARRASDKLCTANKRAIETESEIIARRASDKLCKSNQLKFWSLYWGISAYTLSFLLALESRLLQLTVSVFNYDHNYCQSVEKDITHMHWQTTFIQPSLHK